MYQIETLHAGDMAELLLLLNTAFSGDPNSHRFEAILPKMWFDDEEHMEKHYVIRENGKMVSTVGIYPFTVTIAQEPFVFATVGNMGTAQEARGKGYLNALYTNANAVLETLGVDVARLGGKRSRYARFGYEPCGCMYRFTIARHNAMEFFKKQALPVLTLQEIKPDDTAALSQVRRLYAKNGIAAHRGDDRDLYLTLISAQCVPYAAYDGEEMVGYFTAQDGHIYEAAANHPISLANMLCRFAADHEKGASVRIPPDRVEDLRIMASFCEGMAQEIPSHYKIINWAKVTNALLQLKAQTIAPLIDGELILDIEGYSNIQIRVIGGKGECQKTDQPADLTLSACEASRFLFGVLPPYIAAAVPAEKAAFVAANFPLPLYTHTLDKS